jgi:hypothetical protein
MNIDKLSNTDRLGKAAYSKVLIKKVDEIIDELNELVPSDVFTSEATSQATNITTAVTNNKLSGIITTQSANAAAGATHTFTFNNSNLTTSSKILANIVDYSGTLVTHGIPHLILDGLTTGSISVTIINLHGANALQGTLKIAFTVIE